MRLEDHVFIIASTVVFYLFIKYNNKKIPQKNILFYTMLIPVLFYGYHFAFNQNDVEHGPLGQRVSSVSHGPRASHASSSDIMSDTYPLSSSSL